MLSLLPTIYITPGFTAVIIHFMILRHNIKIYTLSSYTLTLIHHSVFVYNHRTSFHQSQRSLLPFTKIENDKSISAGYIYMLSVTVKYDSHFIHNTKSWEIRSFSTCCSSISNSGSCI